MPSMLYLMCTAYSIRILIVPIKFGKIQYIFPLFFFLVSCCSFMVILFPKRETFKNPYGSNFFSRYKQTLPNLDKINL